MIPSKKVEFLIHLEKEETKIIFWNLEISEIIHSSQHITEEITYNKLKEY